ncbi:hypothetical protein H0N95_01005 [Candidatus Micrarchaeota archaeon]|nr:hypothetical protein [Candidatus Micrarchaeota archaeon]
MAEDESKSADQDEEVIDEQLNLVFPTATIVREMKKHIAEGKMIKKEVKVGMNKFLAEIVKDVTLRMNEYPYSMLDYRMFKEASKPYRMAKEIQREKTRLNKHLDVIIDDCQSVKRDLEEKFGEEEKV